MSQPPEPPGGLERHDPDRQSLRQRAEAQWRLTASRAPDPRAAHAAEAGSLLHDLQVHQIELEIQNEELRQAKEAVEISRARYVDLYDLAPVGYCTVDALGIVTQANLTLAGMLGVPRSALALKPPFSNFVERADQDAWYLLRRHVLEQMEPQSCELRLRRNEGAGASTEVWVQVSASLHPGAVQPVQLHVAVSDISERKKAEDALRQAKEGAEAATKAKARFLANMSHEIRTPLNAIVGTAHLMRRDGVNPKQVAQLERIDVAADHLLGVIDDILDLSKIEAGKLSLDPQDVLIADVMNRVLAMVSVPAKAKGLRLLLEVDHLPQMLRVDPTRLTQALMNYASNAVKFTHQGSVTLRALLMEEDAASQRLRFEVADTGPGIAPDVAARMFGAFEQADASTTRAFGGSGLGLAITRELAHSMGGEVGLTTNPGGGSTFWLMLRLPKGAGTESSTNLSVDPNEEDAEVELRRDYAGRRVLLVEDDLVNLQLLAEMLASTGLVLEMAHDGEEAVEMAGHTLYDAILMDLQMPKLDGLEATRQIRQLPGYARVPIVAVTANAFVEDRQRCAQAGMTDFLTKPLVPAKLYGVLLKWLRQQSRLAAMAHGTAATESAEETLRRAYANLRVLIVDDREEHRQLLRDFLAFVWSDLDLAEDGHRALELVALKPYDLILMDIQMLPMDGLETTRLIRALPHTAYIPILSLTASTAVTDQTRALDAGLNGILRKVFGPDEPYKTILQALRESEGGEAGRRVGEGGQGA